MNAEWVAEYFRLLLPADPRQLDIEGAQLLKFANLPPSLFRYRSYPPVDDAPSTRGSDPERQGRAPLEVNQPQVENRLA